MFAQSCARAATGLGVLSTMIGVSLAWSAVAADSSSASSAGPTVTGLAPGLWETGAQVGELDIPGLPKAFVDKMARDPSASEVRRRCISAEQGLRPPEAMFHRLGGECHYTSWQMTGHRIEATLACTPPGAAPGTAQMVLSGSHDDESFTLTSTLDARDGDGVLQMHMVSHLTGKRAGACP